MVGNFASGAGIPEVFPFALGIQFVTDLMSGECSLFYNSKFSCITLYTVRLIWKLHVTGKISLHFKEHNQCNSETNGCGTTALWLLSEGKLMTNETMFSHTNSSAIHIN